MVSTPAAPMVVMHATTVIVVVLCISFLEGVWTWLLASAAAEVSGQQGPALAGVGLVLFGAWLTVRGTAASRLSPPRRRWLVAGGGLALALVGGTIQSGLLHPLQLVFGSYTPDYRGAGITLLVVCAYLWGRGIQLAARVSREQVIGHLFIAAAGMSAVLVFLPLTRTVAEFGLGGVLATFLLAVAALFLTQVAGAESRQLTRFQWAAVAAGSVTLVVLVSAALTGTFASGALGALAGPLGALSRVLIPGANAVLLAAGLGAHLFAVVLRWAMDTFGVDDETMRRAVERAEEVRPQLSDEGATGAPEVLSTVVAVALSLLFVLGVAFIFYRLTRTRRSGGEDDLWEMRGRATSNRDERRGLLAALSGIPRMFRRSLPADAADRRGALRRHYRTLQGVMARAGRARDSSETPAEYREALHAAFPSVVPQVDSVTDAYMLARYGPEGLLLPDPAIVGQSVAQLSRSLRREA